MTETFLFVSGSKKIEFFEATETHKPFARIEVMAMELDKTSTNGRRYKFAERKSIIKSIIGSPIYYGLKVIRTRVAPNLVKREQEHDRTNQIGFAEAARIVGNKIYATIKITAPKVLSMLKRGIIDFLFSVGGIADKVNLVKKGKEKFMEMVGAVVTHISMWKNKHEPNEAGFPSAKMTKLLEFQECALYTELQVCENGVCKILSGIRSEFEETKAIMMMEEEKTINKTGIEDIGRIIRVVMIEPWKFVSIKEIDELFEEERNA